MEPRDGSGFPKLDIKAARALRPNIHQAVIESVLGGTAPFTHLAAANQFRASLGIDPSLPVTETDTYFAGSAGGMIRPVGATISGSTFSYPMWIEPSPKTSTNSGISHYVYSANGSVHSLTIGGVLTGVGDLNDGGTSSGNGCAYYDNYMYFARDTTISRYGPLDGAPTFTKDYWGTTLGKTALSNTVYPSDPRIGAAYSNHILHRHSDGKLYIADVVNNQGTIHYIQTSKTTVEGDTDNGSTYSKLQVGYGLYPTDMESYGSMLVITFIETFSGSTSQVPVTRSKIAFWDTTSQNINQMIWVEYPDALITAVVNANGTLYFFAGSLENYGCRIVKYVGGYSFEDVSYQEQGFSPHAGAVLASGRQIMFGSGAAIPTIAPSIPGDSQGCVWSLNLRSGLGNGLFNIFRVPDDTSYGVTALASIGAGNNFGKQAIFVGYDGKASTLAASGGLSLNTSEPPVFWSQTFRVPQRFKITKIRIPTIRAPDFELGTKQITPTIYLDDGSSSQTLAPINYGTGTETFVIRPINATGEYNFWLELVWTGSGVWTVGLPITIEYELIPD